MHASFSMIQLIVTPVTQHQRKAARIPLRTLHFVLSSPSFFKELIKNTKTHSLKITEKVSFNIASEASYVYILSGQKSIKNAKNGPFWRVLENLKLAVKQCY